MLFRKAFLLLSVTAATHAQQACDGCFPGTSGYCKSHDTVCSGGVDDPCSIPGLSRCDGMEITPPSDAFCTNSAQEGLMDEGCDFASPICVYDNGGIVTVEDSPGTACARCVNSQRGGGSEELTDFGCSVEMPVCTLGDANRDLAAMVAGTECSVCFNSLDSNDAADQDDGCPPSLPDCALDDGTSPVIWAPGTRCVANCYNTEAGNKADSGCHGDHTYCVNADTTDPVFAEAGMFCSTCSKESCDDKDKCTVDKCHIDDGCTHTDIRGEQTVASYALSDFEKGFDGNFYADPYGEALTDDIDNVFGFGRTVAWKKEQCALAADGTTCEGEPESTVGVTEFNFAVPTYLEKVSITYYVRFCWGLDAPEKVIVELDGYDEHVVVDIVESSEGFNSLDIIIPDDAPAVTMAYVYALSKKTASGQVERPGRCGAGATTTKFGGFAEVEFFGCSGF